MGISVYAGGIQGHVRSNRGMLEERRMEKTMETGVVEGLTGVM